AGLGGGAVVCGLRRAELQRRLLIGATTACAVIGCGLALHFAVRPYKHEVDVVQRGFARWFWEQAADGAEVVCLIADEHRDFGVGKPYEYLAYQRIYSPRHRRGETASVAAAHGKLRCAT